MKFLRQMPKEKMQKLVLVGIFTLIGVAAMVMFWVNEERSSLIASKEKIGKLEPQIFDRERKERAEVLNEPLRLRLVAFVQTQQQVMVTGDLFSWAVREVTLFAERYPVQMLNVRPGQRQAHLTVGGYEIYSVHMEVRGKYDELGRFICGLENHFSSAQIRMVDLTPGDVTGPVRGAMIELGFLIWPETATAWIAPKPTEEPKKKP